LTIFNKLFPVLENDLHQGRTQQSRLLENGRRSGQNRICRETDAYLNGQNYQMEENLPSWSTGGNFINTLRIAFRFLSVLSNTAFILCLFIVVNTTTAA